ncbi:protein NRT1/ PTR FAMILY 8.3-like [Lolium rigidum]|uniref:protein NRT1/ PTR FAMILY 8.3-like n=1 Tax=Lolium rigidum TaxID=89674 RepID=UPI001F5C80CB|nr:protein NRT1/ PTR FAMILY 8.3-like [Lolium rigidum]
MQMTRSASNGEEMTMLEPGHVSSSSSCSSAAATKTTTTMRESRPFTWTGPAIVLGFELLESIAFSGVALNMVVYLGTVLHGTTAFNAAHVDTWNGTTFIVPVIGALLADSYWGKYNTIVASLLFYLAGLVLLTLSAGISPLRPSPCEGISCPPATGKQFSVFFAALYLTSIGTGGVKSALLPFGAEQYDVDGSPEEVRRKQSFFTWFFGAINLGIFVAGTLVSWLQQNVSWALGFGVSTFCLLLAAAGFLAGTSWYRVQLPAGSPLKDILRVIVASLRKRNTRLPAADHGGLGLHEVVEDGDLQKLAHTKGLRCLDKAAVKGSNDDEGPWYLCTVSEVEGVKILTRMAPIWVTCVLYAASLGQMTTTFIQQGMAMDNKVFGRLKVPVASMVSVEVAFMLLWVLLHDAVIMPLARRWGPAGSAGLTQLQRMGVGRFLVVLAMATAALVERRRLQSVGAGTMMGIGWQVPQFVLVAGSDVFCGIAQLEFFYGEAPVSMRSICSALSFLALSLGYYVNTAVVTAVSRLRPGWLAPDLNAGHLDYYFWLWAVIGAGNLLLYMLLAARYTTKQVLHSPSSS